MPCTFEHSSRSRVKTVKFCTITNTPRETIIPTLISHVNIFIYGVDFTYSFGTWKALTKINREENKEEE